MAGKANKRGGSDSAPIIIIRRDEGEEHPHHGGAWKVAYADFVTAMMAFFLLMWLLNATTEEQRTGLADYFAPTNLFGRSTSGSGQPFGGQTPNDAGSSVSTSGAPVPRAPPAPQRDADDSDPGDVTARPPGQVADAADDLNDPPRLEGPGNGAPANDLGQSAARSSQAQNTGAAGATPGQQPLSQGGDYAAARVTPPVDSAAIQSLADAARNDAQRESRALAQAGAKLLDAIQHDPDLQDVARQLSIDIIPQGLRIQVVDAERRPMFTLGSATPTDRVRQLTQKMVPILAALPMQSRSPATPMRAAIASRSAATGNCRPTAPMPCAAFCSRRGSTMPGSAASAAAPTATCWCRPRRSTPPTDGSPSSCCATRGRRRNPGARHDADPMCCAMSK